MRAGDEAAFTPDQLSALLSILPSAEDVELVQQYDGPASTLGKAEQFFKAVAGVPRYQARDLAPISPDLAPRPRSTPAEVACTPAEVG